MLRRYAEPRGQSGKQLGVPKQIRPWRAGKSFFVTRKCQLRRRRRGAWRRGQALIIEVLSIPVLVNEI